MSLGRKIHKTSRRGEERTAKDIGGKRQPASGATKWAKGDVSSADLLVERKDTWSASYRLTKEDLDKIHSHAALVGKQPVFQVAFQPMVKMYAVIDWNWFLQLIESSKRDDYTMRHVPEDEFDETCKCGRYLLTEIPDAHSCEFNSAK